jgi:thioredoxin reductase (NADPH)
MFVILSGHELVFNTEVVGLEAAEDASLEPVRLRSRLSGEDSSMDIRNLFLFVGADPATKWLDGCGVMVDRGGFVVTGAQCKKSEAQLASALETSVPGVFDPSTRQTPHNGPVPRYY